MDKDNKKLNPAGFFNSDAPPPPVPGVIKTTVTEQLNSTETTVEQNPKTIAKREPTKTEEVKSVYPSVPTPTETPPSPGKKFPIKILLFAIVGIVIAVVVVGIVTRLIKKTPATSSGSEITFWGLWEEDSVIKPIITDYESSHPGVKIKYVKNSPSDYRERLVSNLSKGNGPDIFPFHNTWSALLSKELDSVPTNFMSASEYTQTFYPVVASDAASGTGLVGVPLGYDALTLYINEDLFAEKEKQPPTTWNELRDLAKELTVIENDQIKVSGVALGRTENVDHWQEVVGLMLIQNGVNLSNPDGKLLEDALTYFTLFSTVDNVWDETLPNSTTMFASGRLAMYFAPSWKAFEIEAANPELKFRTVPLPQLPKEQPNEPNISYATYWLYGVSSKSKSQDASWEFLKYMTSDQTLEKLFQQSSRSRGFGQVYPKVSMKEKLSDHPVLGSIIKLAPEAKSWYLASRTQDGANGINSQISKYFEDAINLIIDGKQPDKATENLTNGVVQVLSQYGLVRK